VETLTFDGVLAAGGVVSAHLPPTPAWSYPLLDARAGCRVVVKHENVQPTGAFKVRGGVNLAAALRERDDVAGLVTASTGNHAQSMAYAARLAGTRAVVVAPVGSPDVKLGAVRGLGAEVVVHGPTMTEAAAHAHALAEADGLTYVDPGNEPPIVYGHATVYLELLRQHPDLETIYVPIGSGTGAAGACLVRDALAPGCRVVGVQSSAAPAAYRSWTAGELTTAPCRTRMSGLATGVGFALPQSVLRERLDGFLLVSDDDIAEAAALLASHAHTLAEGAGAAALAGLLADTDRPQRCAVVVTGGNATSEEIAALARPAAEALP
jgi:threonine dehydratase